MAQWGKVFAVKPNDLGSVSGTHTVNGEDQLLQAVL